MMVLLLNCLAKASSRKIFIDRLRRSLFFGFLGTLFVVLCLYYAHDSNGTPIAPSVLPRSGTPDMFVYSTTGPHVVIFVMSDKIDDALCYSVGSAYLSGLPVVVAGYQMEYRFLSNFDFLRRAIENANLNPEDVVIVIDSDTVFTGEDIHPFLDRFITQSAAVPEELDALAVRQGRAMAPFIVGAEAGCFAPNVFENWQVCVAGYNALTEKVRSYIATHPKLKVAFPFDKAPQGQVNSGVVIARVWAYEEFLQKAVNLTKTQAPPSKTQNRWDCDQSVYTALFIDALTWEVEKDVFSMPFSERQTVRSPYGVRAGFLDLDRANALSLSTLIFVVSLSELHDERWTKFLSLNWFNRPHSHDISDFKGMYSFVHGLYSRAYAAHGEGLYTKVAVPMWVDGKKTSNMTHISLTPPLWTPRLRPIDIVNTTRHTFPIILHTQGCPDGMTKVMHMEHVSVGAGWLPPMVHNRKARSRAIKYLASAPLFLAADNTILQDSYHAKCGFPFKSIIQKARSS